MSKEPKLEQPGSKCVISVPGSTSNLGPGFDSIGCAVGLRNEFTFEILADSEVDHVEVHGRATKGIPATKDNLALTTAKGFIAGFGLTPPPISMLSNIEVPNARGLGSSSTAIVAGLLAGNALIGRPMSVKEILDAAVEIEGHPDNVAPAIIGGLVVSASERAPLVYMKAAVHTDLRFLFIIPDYMVKTSDARKALPEQVSYRDAIYNLSRTPLVVEALKEGNEELLRSALEDRLHQDYRKPLYKCYDEIESAALRAGALGFCVSGAGPTMLAICGRSTIQNVSSETSKMMKNLGIGADLMELECDLEGSHVTLHQMSASG